jgi:hypothetical protein
MVLVDDGDDIAHAAATFGFTAQLPEQSANAPPIVYVAESLAYVSIRQDVA